MIFFSFYHFLEKCSKGNGISSRWKGVKFHFGKSEKQENCLLFSFLKAGVKKQNKKWKDKPQDCKLYFATISRFACSPLQLKEKVKKEKKEKRKCMISDYQRFKACIIGFIKVC